MSVQSALRVGVALTSADVDTVEEGFHQEHLGLLPEELNVFGLGFGGGGDEGEMEDEA